MVLAQGSEGAVVNAVDTEGVTMEVFATQGAVGEVHVRRGEVITRECATEVRKTGTVLDCVLGSIFQWSKAGTFRGQFLSFQWKTVRNRQ